MEFVRSLSPGLTEVVDYSSSEDMARLVKGGQQFDLIYDTVSSNAPEDPNYEPQLRPLLRPSGIYLAIAPAVNVFDQVRANIDMVTRPLGLNVQRKGYDWFLCLPSRARMRKLNALFDTGKLLKVGIDSTFAVFESDVAISEAMARQQSRRAVGKIVLTIGS